MDLGGLCLLYVKPFTHTLKISFGRRGWGRGRDFTIYLLVLELEVSAVLKVSVFG